MRCFTTTYQLSVLLVALVLSAQVLSASAQAVNMQDSLALVALYNATNGSNWTNNTNWLTEPVSTWFGVTVSGGSVMAVGLSSNNLIGTIPSQLGNLSNLNYLDLSFNWLKGSIPVELGNLANLSQLYLSGNQLTGSIPSELGNQTNLQHVWLGSNEFTDLPDLSMLQTLRVQNNRLTFEDIEPNVGIPNFLYAPQATVGQVQDLTVYADASFTLQVSVGGANNLYQWFKNDAPINGANEDTYTDAFVTPDDAGVYVLEIKNPIADELTLRSKPFRVSVTAERQALVALFEATNGPSWANNANWLSGPIETWSGVTVTDGHVTGLSLMNQQLSGELPPELGNLIFLRVLNFAFNQLMGELPPELGQLSNLQVLRLDANQLMGELPPELGQLNSLQVLDFSSNELTGELPPELGQLSNLHVLNVRVNQLMGTIPAELSQLSNLRSFVVSSNRLTDLPDLQGLASLDTLRVANNLLTFEDLEPNVGLASDEFVYAPQDSVGDARIEEIVEDSTLTLQIQVGGVNNVYQWYKDGTPIAGATGDTYTIEAVTPAEAGQYMLEITNTVVTELTLWSRPITVMVQAKPSVTAAPGTAPSLGSNLDISATLTGDLQPATSQLFYRRSGEATYAFTSLQPDGTSYLATISADFVTERGIDYYVVFADDQTTATFPEINPTENPAHLRVRVDQLLAAVDLPSLTYQMISVPLELDNAQLSTVLEDDYSAYDPNQWRLFRWDAAEETYREFPNIAASFTPGTAFWLNTRVGTAFDVDNGTSVDAVASYPVTLTPGWNQIATPFAFPVAWSSVNGNEEVEPPVAYDGEYRYGQTVLEPWQGYFVFNPSSSSVTLSVPPVEATEVAAKGASSPAMVAEASYLIQLSATVPGYGLRDSENYLGFNEHASEGRDRIDFADPPGIGSYLRLSLIEAGEPLAGSFKPVGGEGQQWEVEVAVEIEGEVLPTRKEAQVVLEEQGQRPAGFAVYVLDEDLGRAVEVVEGVFSVEVSPSLPVRHLQVIVGTKGYAESEGGEIPLGLLAEALYQNYPNPFNPETVIGYQLSQRSDVVLEIFNLLGQRVRVLVQGKQEAGRHEAVWDGQDDGGVAVATGVYLYQLETGGFRATRRMLLLR